MYTGCWLASLMEREKGEASIMMDCWHKGSTAQVGQAGVTSVAFQALLLPILSARFRVVFRN